MVAMVEPPRIVWMIPELLPSFRDHGGPPREQEAMAISVRAMHIES